MSAVILDVGADIGALVLYTPADMDGQEIEISTGDQPRTHNVVRRRDTGDYAAVYPGLPAGDYTIWRPAGHQATTTTITGGTVTTCRWPE
jgi:hypothetical protein